MGGAVWGEGLQQAHANFGQFSLLFVVLLSHIHLLMSLIYVNIEYEKHC